MEPSSEYSWQCASACQSSIGVFSNKCPTVSPYAAELGSDLIVPLYNACCPAIDLIILLGWSNSLASHGTLLFNSGPTSSFTLCLTLPRHGSLNLMIKCLMFANPLSLILVHASSGVMS